MDRNTSPEKAYLNKCGFIYLYIYFSSHQPTTQASNVNMSLARLDTLRQILRRLCHKFSVFSTCFSSALVATYPEINHPVVQLGVLVDCGSAFLGANKKHHITKNPSDYEM